MALSLPRAMPERAVILAMTYVVVVFSILVQGLTVGPLARRWLAAPRRRGSGFRSGHFPVRIGTLTHGRSRQACRPRSRPAAGSNPAEVAEEHGAL